MCVVSMIGDHYGDRFPWMVPDGPPFDRIIPEKRPIVPDPLAPNPWQRPWEDVKPEPSYPDAPPVTREEFEDLKRQMEEMKQLLKRAKDYDEKNGEPDCEIEEKMAKLRAIAKLVDVDLEGII